jgi:VanZ family protein
MVKMKKLNLLILIRISFVVCLFSVLVLALLPAEESPGFIWWDKLDHFFAFFVLSCLLYFRFSKVKWLTQVALPLFSFGLLIEIFQLLSGYRQFSLFDILADGVGIAAGLIFSLFFTEKLKKYLAGIFL